MAPRAVVVFGSVAHNADMPSPRFAWLAAWNLAFVRVPQRQCTGRLVAASTFCRPWASTESSAFDGRPTWRRDRSAMLSTPATGSSAAIRRAVFSETPLSVAISLHVCSAQYLNLVSFEHLDHPFLVGSRIFNDSLTR
jgi:hypothetical protein